MAHGLSRQDWLERLRPGATPIFRQTKDALLGLRRKKGDQVTARELAAALLADPLASLRLVYLANNRGRSRFGSEVATVEHAIMMQGVDGFLDRVAAIPVLEDTPQANAADVLPSLYRLLRLAQHAAWQARDFAVLHTDVRAEEVQVAALLYYAPEFLLWLDAPELARQLALFRRRMPSEEAEESALGFRMHRLRLMLLEAWKIPEAIRDQLNEDHAKRSRYRILNACLDIVHRSRHGWWDEHLMDAYLALADIEHTPLDDVIITVHSNAVRVARYGAWIPAPPAAAWLPMLPGPWPPEPDEADEAEQAASARAEAADMAATVCPAPNRRIFLECLKNIEAHLDASYDLSHMSAVVLRGLHIGLGLPRILFAMPTPDGRRIKARFTLGIPTGDPLRHFEATLGGKDLFGRMMGKMQGVWLSADNRDRLWPMLGPDKQAMIGRQDFYAMSLFDAERPIGLIYADRGADRGADHGQGGCDLDPATYDDFKRFCLLAARGLAKVKPG